LSNEPPFVVGKSRGRAPSVSEAMPTGTSRIESRIRRAAATARSHRVGSPGPAEAIIERVVSRAKKT
jgi:hypothetical protein